MREDDPAQLRFDPAWTREMRATCIRLVELSVFGDLRTANPAALPRLRKRILDLCERWRSLFNDRDWIPQPRERLKNALGAALALRDSLSLVTKAAQEVTDGDDHQAFTQGVAEMKAAVSGLVEDRMSFWSATLERINRANLSDSED